MIVDTPVNELHKQRPVWLYHIWYYLRTFINRITFHVMCRYWCVILDFFPFLLFSFFFLFSSGCCFETLNLAEKINSLECTFTFCMCINGFIVQFPELMPVLLIHLFNAYHDHCNLRYNVIAVDSLCKPNSASPAWYSFSVIMQKEYHLLECHHLLVDGQLGKEMLEASRKPNLLCYLQHIFFSSA